MKKSKLAQFFTATAWIAGIAVVIMTIYTFAAIYTKQAKEADRELDQAQESINKAEEAVKATPDIPTEEIGDTVEAINTTFKQSVLTEEEKALEAGYTLPQLDPEDSESKLSEFALGPISEEMLSPMRDWLGWNVDWSSYPVNPVTEEPMTTARVNSAKELGYVDYTMSYATAPGFPKDWQEYRTQRGLPEDATEEEAIFRWVGDLTGNYPAFLGMVELFGEAKTMGVKNRDISGNEFFNDILKAAAEAETENKGITKFLDAQADPAYSLYNFDWQTYRAKFMIWLSLASSEGRKNWWTREKSYLGPADGTAHDSVEYKFDYTNVAYVRPNFTTDKKRQTDLDSFVFCFKDKNGYRVSEWFGVNATNADAELYTEGGSVKKKDITANSGYNPTKQPEGTTKISKGKVTKEPDEPDEPDEPKKKKYDKKKEKSSVNKKQNIIDGKDPKGVGTDKFQPTKPATPADTVAGAQYNPIALPGQPGQEGPNLPAPGSTNTPSDGGGGWSDYNTTPGGVVVEDHHQDDQNRTENETAETPPIEEQPDHDGDGNSSQNTGMPGGFSF